MESAAGNRNSFPMISDGTVIHTSDHWKASPIHAAGPFSLTGCSCFVTSCHLFSRCWHLKPLHQLNDTHLLVLSVEKWAAVATDASGCCVCVLM